MTMLESRVKSIISLLNSSSSDSELLSAEKVATAVAAEAEAALLEDEFKFNRFNDEDDSCEMRLYVLFGEDICE